MITLVAVTPRQASALRARLVVIGGDSHRLHEEIIAAGGYIKEGRWGGRLNVGQLESVLASVGFCGCSERPATTGDAQQSP